MSGWTEEGLLRAWRALVHREGNEEWRFVHLARMGSASVEAGCNFPLGREALIVSFLDPRKINPAGLPEGKGFDVLSIEGEPAFAGRTAVSLVRRLEGSADIFAVMVVDILRCLESTASTRPNNLMEAFLERVKEWQSFMARSNRPLSLDSQVGLFGELWMLRFLAGTSLNSGALDCWQGPLRAAQDFHIHGGAIEVKSTVSLGSFLAQISSIEQLDGERAPLFLCALRFEEAPDGHSLVDLVSELREVFRRSGTLRSFEALLLVVGYLDEHAPLYGRTLSIKSAKAFRSDGDLPRLRRTELPAAIRSASYTLDLDALDVPAVEISELINEFGLS